jgi:hypothetical protein
MVEGVETSTAIDKIRCRGGPAACEVQRDGGMDHPACTQQELSGATL